MEQLRKKGASRLLCVLGVSLFWWVFDGVGRGVIIAVGVEIDDVFVP